MNQTLCRGHYYVRIDGRGNKPDGAENNFWEAGRYR